MDVTVRPFVWRGDSHVEAKSSIGGDKRYHHLRKTVRPRNEAPTGWPPVEATLFSQTVARCREPAQCRGLEYLSIPRYCRRARLNTCQRWRLLFSVFSAPSHRNCTLTALAVGCDYPEEDSGGDECSSDCSVIRVPIGGGEEAEEEEEEDGYSSSGSVIRVDTNEDDGGVLKTASGSNADEDDGFSSDGSVIRVPASKAGFGGDRSGQRPKDESPPEDDPAADGGCVRRGWEGQGHDGNVVEPRSASQAPAHMKMNLLAASKYFGKKGGASDGGPGAAARASQQADDNPQVLNSDLCSVQVQSCTAGSIP